MVALLLVADGGQLRLSQPMAPPADTLLLGWAGPGTAALSGCGWPGWSSVRVYICQGKVPSSEWVAQTPRRIRLPGIVEVAVA